MNAKGIKTENIFGKFIQIYNSEFSPRLEFQKVIISQVSYEICDLEITNEHEEITLL